MSVETYTPEDLRDYLAAQTRRQLRLDGRTQLDVCRAAGFAPKTLQRIITGERWAGARTLASLLTALSCSPASMFAPVGPEETP